MSKIHIFCKPRWCKRENTFATLMLRLEESSLQALSRDGFMYQGKFRSCSNFLGFEEKLNIKTNKMRCLQICPFSSCHPPPTSAVPLLSPLGSLLAHTPVAPAYSIAPPRCDISACVLPGWQAVNGRKPWSPLRSPPLWRTGVCLRFSQSTQELNHLLRLLSVCQFWLKWADRLKHGWMQEQHDHVRLVFLRNLAKLLSLIVEGSLQFPVSLPEPKGSETRRQYKALGRWVFWYVVFICSLIIIIYFKMLLL